MTLTKASLATLLILGALPGMAAAGGGTLPEKVREANSRFKDVNAAVKEGYAPIPCTSGIDGGAMGIHYVNPDLIKDEAIDLSRPEAVMYEPDERGKMKLVAVEYITTKGPANLEGQLFSLTGTPNRYGLPAFYELHVWAWKDNPKGPFADMNPTVSCRHAHAQAETAPQDRVQKQAQARPSTIVSHVQ
jgi:hypothetical protein